MCIRDAFIQQVEDMQGAWRKLSKSMLKDKTFPNDVRLEMALRYEHMADAAATILISLRSIQSKRKCN